VIVVDTSVWVDYFRYPTSVVVAELQAKLDEDEVALVAPVRVELIGGAGRQDVARLKRVLSALPSWLPTGATWATMESWAEKGGAREQRFGMGDLLIGAIAAEHDAKVWSFDADFARMERMGFVQLHRR